MGIQQLNVNNNPPKKLLFYIKMSQRQNNRNEAYVISWLLKWALIKCAHFIVNKILLT